MIKYIFTNIKNGESSIIKAEDLDDAIMKMRDKHVNMGLGGITWGMVKEQYIIKEFKEA